MEGPPMTVPKNFIRWLERTKLLRHMDKFTARLMAEAWTAGRAFERELWRQGKGRKLKQESHREDSEGEEMIQRQLDIY